MVKEPRKKGEARIHEIRTRFDTLSAVLSFLSLGLRLGDSIFEISRGTFHVKHKLFSILHDILDGEVQLRNRT